MIGPLFAQKGATKGGGGESLLVAQILNIIRLRERGGGKIRKPLNTFCASFKKGGGKQHLLRFLQKGRGELSKPYSLYVDQSNSIHYALGINNDSTEHYFYIGLNF